MRSLSGLIEFLVYKYGSCHECNKENTHKYDGQHINPHALHHPRSNNIRLSHEKVINVQKIKEERRKTLQL